MLLFVNAYMRLIADNPMVAEVLTIELRQSSKFMKEYANPRFAELLKMLGGTVDEGQRSGEFDPLVPAPVAARMVFGILDELALAWLLGRGEKFDIVRAADWVGAFVLKGLQARRKS
jgi:TetR/AcrR family transcriptional regulator, fatty acid metabolism regulator protein